MGWGQVGQHRASGHKGGLGRSGHLKHLWSTVIKEDPDHFGHKSTHRPASVSIITKKWVNVRDLDDLSLIHISEPTRPEPTSYAVFCLKKKRKVDLD